MFVHYIIANIAASFFAVYLVCNVVDLNLKINQIIKALMEGLSSLTDRQLSDLVKEKQLQKSAKSLILHSLQLAFCMLIILAPFLVLPIIISILDQVSLRETLKSILDLESLIIITMSTIFAFILLQKYQIRKISLSLFLDLLAQALLLF